MYQARSPRMAITAGTITSRTTKASIAIATPRPRPNSLMVRSSPSMKLKKTAHMIRAQATTTLPIAAMPRSIESAAECPATCSSRMRLMMKTS